MKQIYFIFLLLIQLSAVHAQSDSIYNDDPTQYLPLGTELADYHQLSDTGLLVTEPKLVPPFWWTNMAVSSLEIILYDQNIKEYEVHISDKNGLNLIRVDSVQNPNYLFLQLEIGKETKPGWFDIILKNKNESKTYKYELKERVINEKNVQGLNSSDLIYLIMPDRFSNGDYSNDSYDDMLQAGINRDKMFFRHGGDLQGTINNLNYLEELGVTAIWLNPVLENDQPYASYHGYAVTDHYKIDKRFGSNDLYKAFVDSCHNRGIKVIMDIVFNHCGHEHWLMKDLPQKEWVHQWPEFTRPNYRGAVNSDPYASKMDTKILIEGWFDYSMPDFNQVNEHLANYLIQNSIWWVEYSGQDAYRIDTWIYPDQTFLSRWTKRLLTEYPSLGMFAETWVQAHAVQSYYAENNKLKGFNDTRLPGVSDFQLHFALNEALTQKQSWTGGISKLYYTIAQDFLYENPMRNVIFLDDHDRTRFFSHIGEDLNKFKSGMAFLLTMRGIPMIYYGTEQLFSGISDPDGIVRQDFPGGWKEDSINKFVEGGRSKEENEAFNYVKKLANYRKNTNALHLGKLTHFVPEDGIYVYFRYDDKKTIMVIMNTNEIKKQVETKRFIECLKEFSKAENIISNDIINNINFFEVNKNSTVILELLK